MIQFRDCNGGDGTRSELGAAIDAQGVAGDPGFAVLSELTFDHRVGHRQPVARLRHGYPLANATNTRAEGEVPAPVKSPFTARCRLTVPLTVCRCAAGDVVTAVNVSRSA